MPHPLPTVSGMANASLEPAWWSPRRVAPALLAQYCPGCGRLRAGSCPLCRAALASACRGEGPAGVICLRRYDGVVRDLITGMKYGAHIGVASWCAELVDEVRDECGVVDMITWAPTSSRRRRERGFDQAEVIARHVARRWAVPARRLLARQGHGHQTGRSRLERLGSPSFRARSLQGRPSIVVLDDVVTTGATLYAAVTALLDAGAGRVTALAVAATPPPAVIGTDSRPVPGRPGR